MPRVNRPRPVASAEDVTTPGAVVIIGGAEDKLRDKVILSRFVRLAGGQDAHIAVISTASSLGDAATQLYRDLFTRLGVDRVSGLRPLDRNEANLPECAEVVDAATGVFLTGGNQLRLSSVVAGTQLGAALLRAHQRGAVIGGTSAGASAVSAHMVAFGAAGATPKHRMVQTSAGLGLLHDMVIDQHFEQRNRWGRLLALVAQSPGLLALGLDEDTAAVVTADHTLEVIGRGAVTIIDGSQIQTDAFQTKGHRPMMVSGAIVHSLPSGYRFDLGARALMSPVPGADDVSVGEREVAQHAAGTAAARRAERKMRALTRDIAREGANSFALERRARRRRQASE